MTFLAAILAFFLSVPGPTAPHCDGKSRCSDGKVERSVGNFNKGDRGHEHPGPGPDDGNNGHGNDDDHDDDSNPGQGGGNHGKKDR